MLLTGPDSLTSWWAALCCSVVSAVIFGLSKTSGLLFVATMDLYKVDRTRSSFPYVFCYFVQAFTGPLTGFLAFKCGVKLVTIAGCVLSAVGIAMCFGAKTITELAAYWGFIYGLGLGFTSMLWPVIVTQHFVKYRTTAMNLISMASFAGFFFWPSLISYILQEYGLSGTFLLLSGLVLNCLPFSLLLPIPKFESNIVESNTDDILEVSNRVSNPQQSTWASGERDDGEINKAFDSDEISYLRVVEENSDKSTVIIKSRDDSKPKESSHSCKAEFSNCNIVSQDSTARDEKNSYAAQATVSPEIDPTYSNCPLKQLFSKSDNNQPVANTETLRNINKTNILLIPKIVSFSRKDICKHISPDISTFENSSTNYRSFSNSESSKGSMNITPSEKSSIMQEVMRHNYSYGSLNTDLSSISSTTLEPEQPAPHNVTIFQLFSIFLEPVFILVLITNGYYASSVVSFQTVIIDFPKDIGLTEDNANFVSMAYSLSSVVSLLFLGYFVDRSSLSTGTWIACMLLFRGLALAAIPFSNGLAMLTFVVSVQAFIEAPVLYMFPLMLADYYRQEVQEVAMSSILFLCAPLDLATPPMIGFFRESLGSYDGYFFLQAALSAFCSICLFLVPVLSRFRCRNNTHILRESNYRQF